MFYLTEPFSDHTIQKFSAEIFDVDLKFRTKIGRQIDNRSFFN